MSQQTSVWLGVTATKDHFVPRYQNTNELIFSIELLLLKSEIEEILPRKYSEQILTCGC